MQNWYPGVLKYVSLHCTLYCTTNQHYSTGKRRYGHPALTGVLPQPWLPIKKGQSLANRIDQEDGPKNRDQAVVLTLRKRYSRTAVRRENDASPNKNKATITNMWDESAPGPSSSVNIPSSRIRANSTGHISNVSDPWRDRDLEPEGANGRPSPRHARTAPLSHRLSFDHATGVITLPDDGEWLLQEEDSDSEEGGTSREATQHEGEPTGPDAEVTSPTELSSGVRHRTYYHHPEKRRTIPGAFPASSPRS